MIRIYKSRKIDGAKLKKQLTKHLQNRVNTSRNKLLELIPEARGWGYPTDFWYSASSEFYQAIAELRAEGLMKSRLTDDDIRYDWKKYGKPAP